MLDAGRTVGQVADVMGLTWRRVWKIKMRKTYNKPRNHHVIPLEAMGFYRMGGKRCVKCGEPAEVGTKYGCCVQCAVIQLEKNGEVRINDAARR